MRRRPRGEALLRTLGQRGYRPPQLRITLSPRLWLASFGATSLWFLIQDEADRLSRGRWPLLAPWLHTWALPVFAVLAVFFSIGWGAVRNWLREVESFAAATVAFACRALRRELPSLRIAGRVTTGRRATCSAWSSSRARRLSPPDPRPKPRRGHASRTRVSKGEKVETQLDTHVATRVGYSTTRARVIALLGPLTVVGGLVWAIVQPYRLTLLHPQHQTFWWLIAEPPLLVDCGRARVRIRDRAAADRRSRGEPWSPTLSSSTGSSRPASCCSG